MNEIDDCFSLIDKIEVALHSLSNKLYELNVPTDTLDIKDLQNEYNSIALSGRRVDVNRRVEIYNHPDVSTQRRNEVVSKRISALKIHLQNEIDKLNLVLGAI